MSRRDATIRNAKPRSDAWSTLVDSNIIGIYIWRLEGQVLEANDAFLRILGYDREDLVAGGLHRTGLTPPDWGEPTAKRWSS